MFFTGYKWGLTGLCICLGQQCRSWFIWRMGFWGKLVIVMQARPYILVTKEVFCSCLFTLYQHSLSFTTSHIYFSGCWSFNRSGKRQGWKIMWKWPKAMFKNWKILHRRCLDCKITTQNLANLSLTLPLFHRDPSIYRYKINNIQI